MNSRFTKQVEKNTQRLAALMTKLEARAAGHVQALRVERDRERVRVRGEVDSQKARRQLVSAAHEYCEAQIVETHIIVKNASPPQEKLDREISRRNPIER